MAMTSGVKEVAARLRTRIDLRMLMSLGVVVACAWLFLEIAEEVGEGDGHRIDRMILLALRMPGDTSDPIGPDWLARTAIDLTALGGYPVLTLVTLGVVGFCLLARRWRDAGVVLAAIVGGAVLSTLFKTGIGRGRPDVVPGLVEVMTASFPSGHATLSAVAYLTLGALVARMQTRRALRIYALSLGIAMTGLIGLTRVFLGVHWPTDVVAGWALGTGWATLCWLAADRMGGRGAAHRQDADLHG